MRARWEDRSVPISIASHLSDIYLEELDKVLGLPEVNSQVSFRPEIAQGRCADGDGVTSLLALWYYSCNPSRLS
jgi:hypothetical protein